MIQNIGIDGDDTLWHNEPIFRLTEDWFRELLGKHVEGPRVEERLFATEMANLRYFGYGIKGFMLSMIETAIEVSKGSVAIKDIQAIIEAGKAMSDHPVELLPGVADVLRELTRDHRLALITKGDLFDQESKIARSGLGDLFERIEVVAEKDNDTYGRILSRLGVPAGDFLMVGNSLKSDILPVLELGGWAIHIPYHITWVHETVAGNVATHSRLYEAESIREIPALLQRIEHKKHPE